MTLRVHLLRSHRWLCDMLLERAELDEGVALVETRSEADLLIYPSPPWPDPDAPEPLRSLRPADFNRIFVFSQADFPFPGAPGMYASLPASRAREGHCGGFYVASNHRGADMLTEDLDAAQTAQPDLLWSFVGTGSNAPVRQRILAIRDPEAEIRDTQEFSDTIRWIRDPENPDRRAAHRDYAKTLGRSLFVACPRGRGPGSIRVFEAMQAGRCPVIISDEWLPPPFVQWDGCTIRVAEGDVARLPKILRERHDEAERLGRAARAVWERFFSPERQLMTLISAAESSMFGCRTRVTILTRAFVHEDTARNWYRWARQHLHPAFGARRK